jgi:hypothetical protein
MGRRGGQRRFSWINFFANYYTLYASFNYFSASIFLPYIFKFSANVKYNFNLRFEMYLYPAPSIPIFYYIIHFVVLCTYIKKRASFHPIHKYYIATITLVGVNVRAVSVVNLYGWPTFLLSKGNNSTVH